MLFSGPLGQRLAECGLKGTGRLACESCAVCPQASLRVRTDVIRCWPGRVWVSQCEVTASPELCLPGSDVKRVYSRIHRPEPRPLLFASVRLEACPDEV